MHCGRGLGGLFCDLSPAAFPAVQSPLEEGRGITSGLMPVPPQRRRKGCPRKIPGAKFCRCDSPERVGAACAVPPAAVVSLLGSGSRAEVAAGGSIMMLPPTTRAGRVWPLASPSCRHARPRERERGRGDRRHLHNAVEPVRERRYDARPIRTKQNLRLSRRLEWVLQGSSRDAENSAPCIRFPKAGRRIFHSFAEVFFCGKIAAHFSLCTMLEIKVFLLSNRRAGSFHFSRKPRKTRV